jgi:uncharacterized protein YcbK (DUF882 family)
VGDLSAHFSRWEFTDHQTGELPAGYPDPQLVQLLECLRSIDGRPLRVVSGYRTRRTNAAVGGARNSQHLVGRAADLESGRFKAAEAIGCGARGVGVDRHGWVVHIDTRLGPVVTFPDN